jgi:hypothetical protein
LFCMEIDVGIVVWLFIACRTTWPTCDCDSLSVGVLLGLELLTRLSEEPIDDARVVWFVVKIMKFFCLLLQHIQDTTLRHIKGWSIAIKLTKPRTQKNWKHQVLDMNNEKHSKTLQFGNDQNFNVFRCLTLSIDLNLQSMKPKKNSRCLLLRILCF